MRISPLASQVQKERIAAAIPAAAASPEPEAELEPEHYVAAVADWLAEEESSPPNARLRRAELFERVKRTKYVEVVRKPPVKELDGDACVDPTGAIEGTIDVVLVVVHGMGESKPASTLLDWAEPLLGRIDWLAKYAGQPRSERQPRPRDATGWRPGVEIIDSVLSGSDSPRVVLKASWCPSDAASPAENPAKPAAPITDKQCRRIAILEARWSESFVPMTRSEVFKWGSLFLWRMMGRMTRQFARTLVVVPSFGTSALRTVLRDDGVATVVKRSLFRRFFSLLLCGFGAVLTAALTVLITVLCLLLSVVMPLLSPLLLIPFVKDHAQNLIDTVISYVGDAATWRERPLRATAMCMVLHNRIIEAKTLLRHDGEIVVLAHSEGAAIAAQTLFDDMDVDDMREEKTRVTQLHTVGAGITLLGDPHARADESREGTAVSNWLNLKTPIIWHNYWAIWDPFAAGPLGDRSSDRSVRWAGSYEYGAADDMIGPAEHAVHNTSSPLTDHQTYAANIAQVIDPIARALLGINLPAEAAATQADSIRESVLIRRGKGLNILCALVVAAMLPLIPLAQQSAAALVTSAVAAADAVLTFLHITHDPLTATQFLNDTDSGLSFWAGVVAVALAAALLIWFVLLFAAKAEREAVWDRLSGRALTLWYLREVLVRLCFAAGAAIAVWGALFAVASEWRLAVTIALGIVVLIVVVAPRLSTVPLVVPERRSVPVPS